MQRANPKARVLIAEDQEHVREALAMLLRGDGYEVELCSSPQEALSAARRQMPEITLLDMNYQRDSTSGIEGLELIECLRKLESTLPIIALTGWGNVQLAVRAMHAGADDFIEKPWRNETLLEKVNLLTLRARDARSTKKISQYEHEDAQKLQTRIVPPRHLVAGNVEVYGESTPAGVVGGDYFGVWQPTPDSVHLCIADVSGKGTPGAMIAAMLYASVSTLSSSGSTPDLILREVEHLLQEQLEGGHYLTIVYAVLDLKSYSLRYINAGHCPPVMLRADGAVEYVGATRPVLGLGIGGDFDVHKLNLNRGDCLVFYTDGISEAAGADAVEFGSEGLLKALRSTNSLEPRQQYQAIIEQVRAHANNKLTDDATLILATLSS